MNKIILLLTATISALFTPCQGQQYGWVDIGKNLPNSSGTVTLSDMYWSSDNEGWICSGLLGEIYHTTDGGKSFSIQSTQYYTNAIYMLNSKEGYTGGLNGRVYRTINGGEAWTAIGTVGSSVRSISFPIGSSIGYGCGDNGKIFTVAATGVNTMNSGTTTNLRSVSFPMSGFGWACGGSSILFCDGIVWIEQDSPVGSSYNGISMINNTIGWAVGASGLIIKTTDGGIHWTSLKYPDAVTLNAVEFLDSNEGWIIGNNGLVLHTKNGGTAWYIEAAGMTSQLLTSIQFTSSQRGYVLGNNKTLLKYGLMTDVADGKPFSPSTYQLFQNYPNPFNPSTAIAFSLPSRSFANLKIFDALGREVAVVISEELSAGSHSRQWNAEGFPGGVYFYRLQAGTFTETKKLLLIR